MGRRSGLKIRRRKPCRFDSGPGHTPCSPSGVDEKARPKQDEDLARWARELGVSYEELVSTLNYAGPTFKDLTHSSEARRAGSTSIPS